MKKMLKRRSSFMLVAFCGLWLTNCVTTGEYQRMKQALGQEILDLRQQRTDFGKNSEKLQNDLKMARLKVYDETKRYKALVQQHNKLKQQLSDELKQLKDDQKAKQNEIKQCGQMLKGRGKKLFDLQDELSKKQQEFAARQAAFEKKSAELNEELAKKQKELKDKQELVKSSLARADRLERQVNKLKKVYTDLTAKLKNLVQTGKLKIQMVKGNLVLQLPEKILFASGSSTVKREGKKAIANVTQILQSMKYRWQVVGHTDSRGGTNSNWRLSARRALSVLFVMVKAGMPSTQISIAGYGQFQPKADNDSAENRSLNRRTELVLLPDLSDIFRSVGAEPKAAQK